MAPRAVFFDLDYTLYDQQQYVAGALVRVATAMAHETRTERGRFTVSLIQAWRAFGEDHDRFFDTWLERHGLFAPERVTTCVTAFHCHRPPRLVPYPGVQETLHALSRQYRLGLITDGEPRMQRSKLRALGVARFFDVVVFAGELSLAKPNPEVFRHALQALDVGPEHSVFVGDHPIRDAAGAVQVGMKAVRVLTGHFRQLPDHPSWIPHHRVQSVREVLTVLETSKN